MHSAYISRKGSAAWLRRAACVLLPGALLLAAPAVAAPPPMAEQLCGLRGGGGAGSEALLEAAGQAERRMSALRGGDAAAAAAILPELEASEAIPSDAALAAYCAAAGEAMRRAPDGTQAQAVIYLLTAYRRAQAAGDSALALLAAYRLALVSIDEPAVAGTRGGSAVVPPGEAEAAEPEPEPAASFCAGLDSVNLRSATPRQISILALECSADGSLRDGDPRLTALANLRLARTDVAMAEEPGRDRPALRSAALERALAAIPAALRIDRPDERAELAGGLAELAIGLGGGDLPAIGAVINELRAGDPEARSIGAALAAKQALARGDRAAARSAIDQAILDESRRPLPARLPSYYLLLAEADPEAAARHIDTAYTILDNLRPLLPRFDPLTEESSFSLYMRDVFAAAVQSELAGASGADEAARIRRAQEIVEAYRQAELQSAFGSECLPPPDALRLADLRPGEIILYPLLLADRVELLYVSRSETGGGLPRYRRLPPNRSLDRARVAELVEQVVVPMRNGDEDWRPAARTLYDALIGPVADLLGPESMLAIVPDGALRALPFAALVAPDGRFLVQQTRLSLIPALAYSQPDGARQGEINVVAASLQRQMTLPAGFFPALEGTTREAEIAVEFAGSGRTVPDFTRADLVGALNSERVDILHLATHAAFNGRSDRAFIVANGEVIRLAELREMIGRSRLRGEALDLIILSACETAVGDDDVSMGLAGAVVQAGARSVIGSLWQVNDLGTADLMGQFYRRYSQGRSRSEAIREAQLALIEAGGDHATPTIWAAFALLGAWR